MRSSILALALSAFAALPLASSADNRSPASVLTEKIFSVNVNGATAENVIRMIAQKAGAQVKIDGDLSKRVSYNFSNTTLENALTRMASDVGFEYSIRGDLLSVAKTGPKGTAAGAQSVKLIEMRFMDAEEMAEKLKTMLGTGEEVHVDKRLNALVIVGSEAAYRRAVEFVALFDRLPQQIMIEAKIVQTNNNFSRELGFQVGDLGDPTMNNQSRATGLSTPALSQTPTFQGKYRIGVMDNRALDIRLIAAEAKGDAKIISRPKVVTINNTRALINSGLVFNVKTLSNVTTTNSSDTETGSSGTVVTGGIERVEAGLQLGVLPSIVDKHLVRLLVDVNNSEPDRTISIDGIPGISTNSANTSIIVENGSTAVIAGLIKQSKTNGRSGVPFLSDIPILGMLFRTDVQGEINNELVILITPKILANPGEIEREAVPVEKAEDGGEKADEIAKTEPDAAVN
jgi:type IV pilus assembly protein PilQ